MIRLFLVFFFIIGFNLSSQNKIKIDSLKKILHTEDEINKVDAFSELTSQFMRVNLDSSQYYIDQLFKYSKAINSNYGFYHAYYDQAFYFFRTSSSDSTLLMLENSLKYAHKLDSANYIAEVNIRIGSLYNELLKFDIAMSHFNDAISILKLNGNHNKLASAYLNLGNIYFRKFEYPSAITYYVMVDSICSVHNNRDRTLGTSLSNLGLIYIEIDLPDKAQFYFEKVKILYEEMSYEHGLIGVEKDLGWLAFKKRDYKKAIGHYSKALDYYLKIEDKKNGGEVAYLLGQSLVEDKRIDLGIKYLRQGLELKWSVKDSFGIATINNVLSETYYNVDSLEESIYHGNKALNMAKLINDPGEEMNSYYTLSKNFNKLKEYSKAYDYLNRYLKIYDSLNIVRNLNKLNELEVNYQTQKKEQEISLLKSQNQLAEEQKTNQRNILLGGIGLTSILGLFFFFLYKNRQETTKKLQELDAFKSKLFANISHEFRTPLTLISGPMDVRLNNPKLKLEDKKEFEMINRNTSRLLGLVNQLLDLSKLESGHYKLKVAEENLTNLLKSLASSFLHQADQKSIEYKVSIQDFMQGWFDNDIVEKIVINLLSNAFKYTPELGNISFTASIKEDKLQLCFENDSKELVKEQIENIFNRFYQVDENAEGVGIGLSLVKELVILSHGTISVENTFQKSMVFKVILPILKTQFKEDECVVNGLQTSTFQTNDLYIKTKNTVPQIIDDEFPIILIVDDHEDIRTFIKSTFKNTYQIIEASDGEIGINKAIDLVPDIIISDVMMPKRNGFQLTETLKQDERTCHIPIILLTAKVEDADKYKGLEIGADDYITKPFKTNELQNRVKNLISSRIKLRERYSQEIILKPKDIAITSFDLRFFEKIQTVLDEKLTESSFSVDEFSKAVDLSRMQLHRKLNALTGLSASEFIRSQRIKLAAGLLKNSNANVSEIGYAVGFNDHSYFTKCFKEVYGCSPSEFVSKS